MVVALAIIGAPTACTTACNGISSPFFKMRRSKVIPSVDSDSPLARDLASVTWPAILVSCGTITVPPESISTVTFAVTGSPSFAFLESSDFASSAGITVPGAILTASVLGDGELGGVCASTAEVSISRTRSLGTDNVMGNLRCGKKKLYMTQKEGKAMRARQRSFWSSGRRFLQAGLSTCRGW